MKRFAKLVIAAAFTLAANAAFGQTNETESIGRNPAQPVDTWYTQQIQKYTTGAHLNSKLTDYLPASKTVPTPAKVLGDVSGAPGILPYAEDVYKYFRLLAASSPRIKVITVGHSEEGREMIAAAIADESLLAKMKANDARLAQLADPRTVAMDDRKAEALVNESFPIYYITGTIHSPETGAPTALMELAYRLIVDDAPYIQYIRTHQITLITPVVEVDGRDRMVDVYKWHVAHPGDNWPRPVYWGHYVAHDNNRDAMGMTLALTRNVLDTYLGWHAQVLHDLHESVPFLYDNTVGDGPYNAWIDPILGDEWAALGWNNVQQMQNLGMPGVFTHGNFDTWSPGYLMFLAAMHNGISRLYETFGNGGADTEKRILSPNEYSRTWFRENPPYPVVEWSQRDNNNYEQSALLTALYYFAQNGRHFLSNYYLKSKRSVLKPENAGPAAYVLPLDERLLNRQVELLKVMRAQHVEIHRLSERTTVTVPAPTRDDGSDTAKKGDKNDPKTRVIPAGSYVIRMDQPFSRVADALLDRQYWAPDDPQKRPYDDTGWSFSQLFNVGAIRVTDNSVLKARMEKVADTEPLLKVTMDAGPIYAINNSGQTSLAGLVYSLKNADISIAEEAFESGGHQFVAGSLVIKSAEAAALQQAADQFAVHPYALSTEPSVPTHIAARPRIAFIHTWLTTQTEGWWRQAFDREQVPFDYISTQTVGAERNLRGKYDVIIFAPAHASPEQIVNGVPMYGNPIPWQSTPLTPNIGKLDQTADMRPGLTNAGVEHLREFIQSGGLLITCGDTARFAIDEGFAPGVFVASKTPHVVGSVLKSIVLDSKQPVTYGYSGDLPVYSESGMAFTVGNMTVNRSVLTEKDYKRPTGRGGVDEEDVPEGRPFEKPAPLPDPKPWEAAALNEEQTRNNPYFIPEAFRPRVLLRFADGKSLLLSGLLENGGSIAELPVVVQASLGQGHVLLFGNNPIYRGETIGTYGLVFNALLNYDHLLGVSGAKSASSETTPATR